MIYKKYKKVLLKKPSAAWSSYQRAWTQFRMGNYYKELIEPLKNKIDYPDNYIERIFAEAYFTGRKAGYKSKNSKCKLNQP